MSHTESASPPPKSEALTTLLRKTILDAPDEYGAHEASAWAAGYNKALSDFAAAYKSDEQVTP